MGQSVMPITKTKKRNFGGTHNQVPNQHESHYHTESTHYVVSQRYLKTQFEAQVFCVFPCNLFFLAAYNLAIIKILHETNLCT